MPFFIQILEAIVKPFDWNLFPHGTVKLGDKERFDKEQNVV